MAPASKSAKPGQRPANASNPVDPPKWKVRGREFLRDCQVFTVSREDAESPRTGRVHGFHRIDSLDWVNVVAITPDDQVVMISQYRHGSHRIELEIPGGLIDPGETPAEAAARELLEETGYRAPRVEPIGTANPNPALFGNTVHSFVAWDARPVAEIQNTSSEETVVQLVSRDSIRERLAQGEIRHALVVTALYFFALTNERRQAGGEMAQ